MQNTDQRGQPKTSTSLRERADRARRLSHGLTQMSDRENLLRFADELDLRAYELERSGDVAE